MKIFLIVLAAIIIILLIAFAGWALSLRANCKCPLCAIKKLVHPTRLTIDISDEEDCAGGAAAAPPMGWASWNAFRNHIDQDMILDTAKAMKACGLLDAGYQYINIDDCWQSSQRDADGKLQGDLGTFAMGMPNLIKELNRLGFKAGLYSSNGYMTCEDMPASLGKETLDAKTFASWGCEYLKYDFCHKDSISGDCPAIERLELNSTASSSSKPDIVLLPEQAQFTGRARVIKTKDLKSGRAIGFLNHGAGSASFEFGVPVQGEYALTLVFQKDLSKKESYVQVIVNGKLHEVFFPYGTGFSDTGRVQLVIRLNAGQNTITLKNPVVTLADSTYLQYKRMGNALREASAGWAKFTGKEEKPIVFSICEWGTSKPWLWGAKAGNLWRTTHDIFPNWKSIMFIYDFNIRRYSYCSPGHWNDPDMLEVGNGRLTYEENKSHFTLWCMMAAPLILGNDVREFADASGRPDRENETLKIVTNRSLIAVDRDPLGKAAKRIRKGPVDIIARPLNNGDAAVCFLNRKRRSVQLDFSIDSLSADEYIRLNRFGGTYEIHNLWTDERFEALTISDTVAPHGVQVYRIKAV